MTVDTCPICRGTGIASKSPYIMGLPSGDLHRHARERMPADLPRPQIVQPWWFGEPFFKATGFYLRGLPPLAPTHRLTPPKPGTDEHKRWSAVHRAPPGPDRWKFRSRTFAGVADACADQWGDHAMMEASA